MSDVTSSEKLAVGELYSRKSLAKLFDITDATLNNGVFKPKGHSSVWLFVTKNKVANRTPYKDHLAGDILHWQGQASGTSDPLIIEHEKRGLELLLFYRDEPKQYADSGFRYLGLVEYVDHKVGSPTNFTLRLVKGG